MSKKSPQLRFKGFTDDWEERKLGDIFVYKQGQQVPVENQFTKRGKNRHRFIRIVDLTTNNEAPRYIEYSGDNIISSTDLFMIRYGQPGVIGYGYKGVIANNLFKLIPKIETYNLFFKYILDSMYPKIQSLSSSTTMPAISFKSLDVLAVRYPDKKEQEKIGSFFAQLDNTIALHQRKLDLLKEQKKGYLQKMFPKNGEKVPELRFAGFADDWELRKSKELCTISTGKGNTQDKVDDGAYPFYVRSATIEKSDEYLYDQEAVLTVGDGVGTGKVYHYVNGKYNLHQRVYRMYDFKDVSAKYFYYYFSKNFYKRVMSMTAKTSVDSVRMEMIADMNIVFPSVKEQEKIVELFSNLDNTIALHQRKLDLLKEQKKGYLQKMFV
ncbi:restriction endonuclease subunit S [Lactococcus garvieae]|uniref:restriction endonuclease subunit S n=1 Tax=Lactococcus garvieae TaxID=1363 RepID=UPI003851B5B8